MSYRKSAKKNLHCMSSFLCQFILISSSTAYPFPSDVIAKWPLWIYIGGILCDVSWVNGRKHENLSKLNTSWLTSIRTWYYFKLCFSFSCSGYDLILIKKSHTLNCYSFLQKFLLEIKTQKLVIGYCDSSIYW